jgi:WD40 repeat protein
MSVRLALCLRPARCAFGAALAMCVGLVSTVGQAQNAPARLGQPAQGVPATIAELQQALKEKDQALARARANFLAELAAHARVLGDSERALRFAVHAARATVPGSTAPSPNARAELAAAVAAADWIYRLPQSASAVLSPDGTRAIIRDGGFQLWDIPRNKLLAQKSIGDSSAHDPVFSPDGTKIVADIGNNLAQVFRVNTGFDDGPVLRGHTEFLWSYAFSPDGNRVVTASEDKTARVWEAATGRLIAIITNHTESVTSAAFSPDGTKVVTASYDRTARVSDAATGRPLALMRGHVAQLRDASFSPDGTKVVTVTGEGFKDPTARVWNAQDGRQLLVLRDEPDPNNLSIPVDEAGIDSAEFSPDGSRILTVGTGLYAAATVWDASSGKKLAVMPNGGLGGTRVATLIENGRRAATDNYFGDAPFGDTIVAETDTGRVLAFMRGDEGTVRIWAMDANPVVVLPEVLPRHPGGGLPITVEFNPDRSRVVVSVDTNLDTSGSSYQTSLWDVSKRQRIATLQADTYDGVAMSPDGTVVLTTVGDDAVIWDGATGREIKRLVGQHFSTAPFSRDGHRVVTISQEQTVLVWDLPSGREVTALDIGADAQFATLSPDGKRVLTAPLMGKAQISDVASRRALVTFGAADSSFNAARFSPDGSRVLTLGEGMQIWDAGSGQPILELGDSNGVGDAQFSADGTKIIARGGMQYSAKVWDAASGEPIFMVPVSNATQFSPDGKRIVAVSNEKLAVFDADTGRKLAETPFNGVAVAFDQTGAKVLAVSDDGPMVAWDVHLTGLSLATLLHEACANRLRGVTTLSWEEMRIAGYPSREPAIDVCAGID